MFSSTLSLAALLSLANAHGVILNAQGTAGSPASVGFQVDSSIARNCTGISPCQQDTTIIRDAEIAANIVNECGRTELTGNIDVGENTESALSAGAVTQVTAGGSVTVTIHQVNADGAGPYACDIDMTSNAGIISQNLTVTNNVPGVNGLSQDKEKDFNITVALPDNLACTGASTGNICTIRCRNNAVAGPFGGCFPVQQTDITATANSANTISTAQTLDGITAQIAENKVDLPVAIADNVQKGSDSAVKANAAMAALLAVSVTTSAFPQMTLDVTNVNAPAAGAADVASATTSSSAKKSKATKASSVSAASATATASTKKNNNNNNNNNNKRDGGVMRWAKRMIEESN